MKFQLVLPRNGKTSCLSEPILNPFIACENLSATIFCKLNENGFCLSSCPLGGALLYKSISLVQLQSGMVHSVGSHIRGVQFCYTMPFEHSHKLRHVFCHTVHSESAIFFASSKFVSSALCSYHYYNTIPTMLPTEPGSERLDKNIPDPPKFPLGSPFTLKYGQRN